MAIPSKVLGRIRSRRALSPRGALVPFLASLTFGLTIAACTPPSPQAHPSEDEKIVATLRADAEDGKPESKIALANVLAYGKGATPERRREAAVWYRRAAEQGNADGQFTLALWLWTGQDVSKDRTEAVGWWRKAADQGRSDAQYWLAGAYRAGEGGLPRDLAEAARWFRLSAEQDFGEAQSSLGQMYRNGEGVPRDDREAVAWLRKAAERHIASGEHYLARMYAEGRGVPRDDAEAARLHLLAAEADFTVSMTELGEAYEAGRGVSEDRVCAYFWYGFADKRGFSIGANRRDALASQLSSAERNQGDRMVAAADFEDGVIKRPRCPSEKTQGTGSV